MSKPAGGRTVKRGLRRLAAPLLMALALMGLGITAPASATTQSAVIGHLCDGSFGNIFKFTIIADGTIPQNSTWTVSASNTGGFNFQVAVDSALIQTTRINQRSVSLKAQVALSSGTVIKATPSYFSIPAHGSTSLAISGYGGSDTVYFTQSSGPC